MNNILLEKEVQYEEIQTEYGIFTSNIHLGLTAQEVYEKWLYDKENPKPVKLSLEEEINLIKEENEMLREQMLILVENQRAILNGDLETLEINLNTRLKK